MEPIVRAEGIDKKYPGVHALKRVDLDVFEGEVHLLLGENGAGKSTLLKIMSAAVLPDHGKIVVKGQEFHRLNPKQAQGLGIGMVHQELSLVQSLSVTENIFLGRLVRNRLGVIDWKSAHAKAGALLEMVGIPIPPQATVRELTVSEQQLVEIARVLSLTPQILFLDEPTSALSQTERERLFVILRRLKDELGVATVYTTHRLAEVFAIGQKVTVLRDGEKVGTLPIQDANENKLIEMMIGRRLARTVSQGARNTGDVALAVRELTVPGKLHRVSFDLKAGEILGVFGLMGAGQTQLARALLSLAPSSTGEIFVAGKKMRMSKPSDAIRAGLGYLPRDRHEALVPMLSIPPNVTLAKVGHGGLFRWVNLGSERKAAQHYVRSLDIVPPILERPVLYLSGGNKQKVVLARWLHSGARVLILDDPTRGIDVGAKEEVFNLMSELARAGVAILFISSEIREILTMADRTIVLKEGSLVAEFDRESANEESLLRSAMLGRPK